jgi:hypothetical protein
MKQTVYCNAVQNGNEEVWSFLWERAKTTNVASEKDLLLSGLACSKEKRLLNR